ncbi:MAG: hypothetical protein V4787_03560 [Pseudomonadota bacterium]
MQPQLIIKHINRRHRGYWSRVRQIRRPEFEALLVPWWDGPLTGSQYSRLRNDDKCSEDFAVVLANPEVQQRIEIALACPGLFACINESEVDALIAPLVRGTQVFEGATPSDESLMVPDQADRDGVPLSEAEAALTAAFSAFIQRQTGHLVCWVDPPSVGGSFLAYTVASCNLFRDAGIRTYVAQPFSSATASYLEGSSTAPREEPFDAALRNLAQVLGLAEHSSAQSLLDKLLDTGSTLFVLHADTLPIPSRERPNAMHQLLLEAKGRGIRRADNQRWVPFVLVGVPPDDRIANRTARFNMPDREIIRGPDAVLERSAFFERQWRRYCELRGILLDAEAGSSRLKRVRHYYNSEAGPYDWPGKLRLHAFFASNYRTFGYFDPTAGWTKMAGMGMERLPIDVQLYLGELVRQLTPIPEDRKRRATLRAVRWCSTAVYWLTMDAVLDLGQKGRPRTPLKTFHAAAEEQEALIEISQDRERRNIYKMDLGLRAVLQDRWMRRDPLSRAQAHHLIAHRLLDAKVGKELLRVEFPIEPHWGESRLHFLAEGIRHLIRACDQSKRDSYPRIWPAEGAEPFPAPPTSSSKACNPYQVINYCFGHLYWRELNGNGPAQHNRKLALRHGAYHLTAELLQLMSDEQQLGKPHWALNEAYVPRYLREVAYAQLDLGDLKAAKSTLERLTEKARTGGQPSLELVDYHLDLTVVLASMNKLGEAKSALTDASALFESVIKGSQIHDIRLSQIRTRISARHAHLAYLKNDYEGALAHCEHIVATAPAAMVREVAHTYISTLGAMGRLEDAVKICVSQLFENSSRNLHHEALGFRVALGHAFRKLKLIDAAEVALDGAYEDILQYGCAERTYLAMLLEAGRILYHQGRFVRAYAAYLRPCFDRAQSRGYTRTAEHARSYARKCLERSVQEVPETGWSAEQIKHQLTGRGDYLHTKRPEVIDTRYSYDPIAAERWLPRLQNRAAMEQELSTIGSGETSTN